MSALIATLRDDFEDALTAAAWSAGAAGSATAAETAGQARFTLPSSTAGTHTARYTSVATYDLTGGSFYITIGTMVATGVAATAFFQLYFGSGANTLQWIQLSGTIYARKIIAGVSTDLFSAAWSSTTYKYLRISESGGTITWWSSTNGTSWTSRATLTNPFAVTDLSVDFGATCGNIASPGSFRLDDVNLILPALATNWRWTQIVWPLANRYKVVTLALDTVGTAQGYVVTADGIDVSGDPSGSVRYWAGPASGGRQLTEQASDAAAKAMAVNIPVDGRFDLPTIIEARVIRVYHRSIDGSAYTLREVYPRRLVQADDIEAEAIRALHIAANSITADRLDVDQLSAITADCGTLTAGVIDGVTIYAGGGVIKLYSVGQQMLVTTAATTTALFWTSTATNTDIAAIDVSTADLGSSTYNAQLTLRAGRTDASYIGGTITLQAFSDTKSAAIVINASEAVGISIDLQAPVTADSLAIGGAFGATDGQILATVSDSGTTNVAALLVLGHNSSGIPAPGFGADVAINLNSSTTDDQSAFLMRTVWATATHASRKAQTRFFVYDTAARRVLDMEANGAPMIGLLGAAAVVRQNVTGTLTGATLAQLTTVVSNILTALTNLGATTNSTT